MTARTSHKTVTFTRPFFLSGIGELQPAGVYRVETDEEQIPGLSFSAYRRVATLFSCPRGTGSGSRLPTSTRWNCKPRRNEMRTQLRHADN